MQERRHSGCGAAHLTRVRLPELAHQRHDALDLEVDAVAASVAEELHTGAKSEDVALGVMEFEHSAGLKRAVAGAFQIRHLSAEPGLARPVLLNPLRDASARPHRLASEVVAAERLVSRWSAGAPVIPVAA